MNSDLQKLIDLHAKLLESNPYCYFELAFTRATDWMAWICTHHRDVDPNRKVLAQGQGDTPEEAATRALKYYTDRL